MKNKLKIFLKMKRRIKKDNDIINAYKAARRKEEIKLHGKLISFRKHIRKIKNKYDYLDDEYK